MGSLQEWILQADSSGVAEQTDGSQDRAEQNDRRLGAPESSTAALESESPASRARKGGATRFRKADELGVAGGRRRGARQPAGRAIYAETRDELLRRLLDPTLTLEEAAQVLDVCPTTVRRYTNRGVLPHFRTSGNQRRFRLSHVLAFLEAQGAGAIVDGHAEFRGAPTTVSMNGHTHYGDTTKER